MLLWSKSSRRLVIGLFVVVVAIVFGLPFLTLAAAAVAGQWNGAFPSNPTTERLVGAVSDENLASVLVTVQTALIASVVALILGTCGAIATRTSSAPVKRIVDAAFHLPIAVPSVALGLGLLIGFNDRPLLLGGTRWIVIIAHTVLVIAFTFSTVSAALQRIDPELALAAKSLGASDARVLGTITIPLLVPSLGAAAGLSMALSLGELGATMMVYPATWKTLPVTIATLTDRGQVFDAAALTCVLVLLTTVILAVVGRIRQRVR